MNTTTGGHWYTRDGQPMHWVQKADGKGTRNTTLRDARKLNLLPSVTNILKLLNKPELNNWIQRQAVLAVLTTPRLAGEGDDDYVTRVLDVERQQDQEAEQARDRGTQMHDGLESLARGTLVAGDILPWITPAWNHIKSLSDDLKTEEIIVGDGYAGRLDLMVANDDGITLVDYKTTKTIPKKPYDEHRLQLAAYANAVASLTMLQVKTANLYISTVNQGEFKWIENEPWEVDFIGGFRPLLQLWQWKNNYVPEQ